MNTKAHVQKVTDPQKQRHIIALTVGFVFVCLFAISVFTFSLVSRESTLRQSELLDRSNQLALFFEQEATGIISHADSYILALREYYIRHGDLDRVTDHKMRVPLDTQIFSHVTIIDQYGTPIYNSAHELRPTASAQDRPYFQSFVADPTDRLYVSLPHRGRNSDQIVVRAVRPIFSENGEFNGVIFMAIKSEAFVKFFRSVQTSEGSTATLVGLDKKIRARSSYGRFGPGQDISGSLLWQKLAVNPIGSYQQVSVVDGIERIYAYRITKNYPLVVAIGMPIDNINQSTADYEGAVYGYAGFIALILILGSALGLREVVNGDRLKQSNAAKSEFLGHMSHELRTPLNSVIGFSEMISSQVYGKVTPSRYVDYAANIHYAGRHLLSVIDNILDLVKIEAGERELIESKVDPTNCLKSCLAILADDMEGRQITPTVGLHHGDAKLWVDETMLRQILINIIGNAVKFSPDGGTISIHTQVSDKKEFEFTVRDQGPGIRDEDLAKILEPFGQARDDVTMALPGTGLGLPISRQLAALNDGDLHFDTSACVGTTVSLRFKAKRLIMGEQA